MTLSIVNLAPVAQDDTGSIGEDAVSVTGNVITGPGADADTAPDSDPLTVTLAEQAGNPITIGVPFTTAGGGTLTLDADGSYSFAPGTAYNGLDVGETATETITYTVDDGNGGTDTATLVITINGANDAPVAADITLEIKQDEKVTARVTATDVDGHQLTFSGPQSGPTNGIVSVDADGTFKYVPRYGFSGSDEFTVLVDDGHGGTTTARVSIVVTPGATLVMETPLQRDSDSQPTSEPTTLVIDGIILDAVNDVGSLGGNALDLRLDGIIIETVNRVSRLEQAGSFGVSSNDWRGPIAGAAHFARLADDASRAFPATLGTWDVNALTGFSVRMDAGEAGQTVGSSERHQIVVDTLVRDRVVFAEVSSTFTGSDDRRVENFTVLQADGRPLPKWANQAANGLLLIEAPTDQQTLALRITARLNDGVLIDRAVIIQLPSGEVHQLPDDRQRPLMFDEQLRQRRAN